MVLPLADAVIVPPPVAISAAVRVCATSELLLCQVSSEGFLLDGIVFRFFVAMMMACGWIIPEPPFKAATT